MKLKELYEDAERQIKSLKVLSYLVIAMAVILSLLVGMLWQPSISSRRTITSIKASLLTLTACYLSLYNQSR
ncbi:hypothetical protein [Pontibacter flavimaris]|uniref:Uncharacterized protein n=1 Tax=Pontibacter flavimaris TaxID=1797110 RepID=A0A1Q5PHB1_9BACT|nr:hypothetical protein [Pontibacter flavimaris]OKL41615.1 hypothetical protein A3841_11295 [Pontibacter flavimaris]